jgi:transposase
VPEQEISTRASSWSAHIEENKQNQLFNHRGVINSLSLRLFLFTKNKEDEGSRPALQHAL